MELFQAIQARHSYRGTFKNLPVPEDDPRNVVQAGQRKSFAERTWFNP
jgi:hypothetical protein